MEKKTGTDGVVSMFVPYGGKGWTSWKLRIEIPQKEEHVPLVISSSSSWSPTYPAYTHETDH